MEHIPEKLEGVGVGDEKPVDSQSAELVARKGANAEPSICKNMEVKLATP